MGDTMDGGSGAVEAEDDDLRAAGAATFDSGRFRRCIGHFATGVTIVTAMEDGQPVGFTCQAFTRCRSTPRGGAGSGAAASTSWPRIAAAGSVLRQHPRRGPGGAEPGLRRLGRRQVHGAGLAPRHQRRSGASTARWPGWTAISSWPTKPATTSSSWARAEHGGAPGAAPHLLPGGFGRFEPEVLPDPGLYLDPVEAGD